MQAEEITDQLDSSYLHSVANDSFEKVKKEVFEPWTVARENIIMHRHYGEPFRARWHNSTRVKEASAEQESVIFEKQDATFIPLPIADFTGENEKYSFCNLVIPNEGKRIERIKMLFAEAKNDAAEFLDNVNISFGNPTSSALIR